jgi:hypothetical protein
MLTNRRTGPFRALMAMHTALLPTAILAFTADAADAGGSGGSTPPAGEAKPDAGKASGSATAPVTAPPEGHVPQAQVNHLLAQVRRETEAKFVDAVAAQAELKTIKDASASDLEKAVNAATAEATKTERARNHGILIAAEVRAQAAGMHFRNPIAALALLNQQGKLAGVKVADDGTVDAAAVATALEAIKVTDPYLIDEGKAPAAPPAGDVGLGGATSTGGKTPVDRSKITPGTGTLRNWYEENSKTGDKAKAT